MASALKKKEVFTQERRKILLVDDNYDFYVMMKAGIEDKALCDYAPDGFSALQMIKKNKYDAIICDIFMPYLDGVKLISEFTKKHYNIPFILVTGDLQEKVASEAFQAGAYNVLQKPFKVSELLEKVELAIQLNKAEQGTSEFTEQEQAHIYNMLKMYYYDVEKIILLIRHFQIPMSYVQEEIEKKAQMGRCIFDDLQNLKYFNNTSRTHTHES